MSSKKSYFLYYKISFFLVFPILIFFLVLQHYVHSMSTIISKSALVCSYVENPIEATWILKEKFSDILINPSSENPTISKTLSDKPPISLSPSETNPPEKTITSDDINPEIDLISINENNTEEITEFVPEDERGTIIEETFKGGAFPLYLDLSPGTLANKTKINSQELEQKINTFSNIKLEIDDEPLVLLFSTHATESFEPCDRKFYDKRYNSRSIDNDKNVTRIEDKIAEQLNKIGIKTIVDKTQHDFPSYNGSYNRSAETINNYMKKYPSIKIVLDIHRDAIERENGERVKPITTINGKKAAQIMIISGCDDGYMNFPDWEKNLNFAVNLQQELETSYPTLTRPIFFCYRKYNMNLCPKSLLIEFGSNSNSLNEVLYSGELFGKALANLILSYNK